MFVLDKALYSRYLLNSHLVHLFKCSHKNISHTFNSNYAQIVSMPVSKCHGMSRRSQIRPDLEKVEINKSHDKT